MIKKRHLWYLGSMLTNLRKGWQKVAGLSLLPYGTATFFEQFGLKLGRGITQSILNVFTWKRLQNVQKIWGYNIDTTIYQKITDPPVVSPSINFSKIRVTGVTRDKLQGFQDPKPRSPRPLRPHQNISASPLTHLLWCPFAVLNLVLEFQPRPSRS